MSLRLSWQDIDEAGGFPKTVLSLNSSWAKPRVRDCIHLQPLSGDSASYYEARTRKPCRPLHWISNLRLPYEQMWKLLEGMIWHGAERLPVYTKILIPSFQIMTKTVSAHLCFCQLDSLENKANKVSIVYLPLEGKEITRGMACHLKV